MKTKLLAALSLIFCLLQASQAQNIQAGDYKFRFGAMFEYSDATGVFSLKSDNNNEFKINPETTIKKMSYTDYYLNLNADYFFNKYSIQLDLPIHSLKLSYQSLQETYDSSTANYKYSLSQIDYLGLSAKYSIIDEKSVYTPILDVKIPLRFEKSIYNLNNYDFYYAGAFEALIGAKVKRYFKDISLTSSFFYNYRALELKDQVLLNLALDYSKVENTSIGAFINTATSLSSYKNSGELNPRYVSNQEDFVDIGLRFSMILSESLMSDFSYRARFFGKKTLYKNTFNFKLDYYL